MNEKSQQILDLEDDFMTVIESHFGIMSAHEIFYESFRFLTEKMMQSNSMQHFELITKAVAKGMEIQIINAVKNELLKTGLVEEDVH